MITRPRQQLPKRRVSATVSVQAPTGGLNARDALANMKETEAVEMINFFPTPASVDLRNGYVSSATGLPGAVETLAAYNVGATKKLFAASVNGIYDVTATGTVGAPAVTGLTNARFQYITLGTAGGYYLMMVNGADDLRLYDGTTWTAINATSTPAITGVATANIIHINNFKNRVFLIEKNTFKAWYLPVSSIGGAASALDLSGLFKLGGYLMAMANWTIDNAAGIDDYAAFITSEGEVALFKGTNPGDATAWALVGTFRMGAPIGRRCFTKAGADVLVLTTDGAFPLSKALLTDRSQQDLAATDKIRTIINADIASYKQNYGWQPIIHPAGQKIIINVPVVEGSLAHQYVMNTANGSWTRFDGWNANCFEELGDKLYFGGNTIVYQCDTGNSDNGDQINATCQQAYSYFGSKGTQKLFKMVRAMFIADGEIFPSIAMSIDFITRRNTTPASYFVDTGSIWNVAPWDTSSWQQGNMITKRWQSISGIGYAGGVNVSISAKNTVVQWQTTDIVLESGGTF